MAKKAGRTVGGVTYTLVYDAENRLQQVKQGGTVLASYTYDADGNRVKAVMGSSTTGGLLPRMARITTKAETRFVQIGEIRGRENQPVFCHIACFRHRTDVSIQQLGVIGKSHTTCRNSPVFAQTFYATACGKCLMTYYPLGCRKQA